MLHTEYKCHGNPLDIEVLRIANSNFFIYFDILLHDVKKVENDAKDSPPSRMTGPIPL